jgi:hypothetical protein
MIDMFSAWTIAIAGRPISRTVRSPSRNWASSTARMPNTVASSWV